MKFLLSFILFSSCFLIMSGQVVHEHKPVVSTGKMPQEFITLSSEKYINDLVKVDKNTNRKTRKDQQSFILSSSFYIDELLLSGKVLFNDPISNYADRVLSELLSSEPELRKKLRVYTIKSPSVNAFATDNGIIMVTMGLLAQLENEAQLAYILAHEVTHFEYSHSMNKYLETQKIGRGDGQYRTTRDIDEKLIRRNNYSRELETEADMHGLEIYLKTDYSLAVVSGVFDVLEYSYLPFDLIEFDRKFLETKHITFPEEYLLEDIEPISGENYNDEESTHPSVKERRQKIVKKISALPNEGKQEYIISREEFERTRDLARYELSRLHMLNQEYGQSLYNTFLLLREYPEDPYLRKSKVQALYGLAKYANNRSIRNLLEHHSDVEGFSQQLFHILNKMSSEELNVLALVHAYELSRIYPGDIEIKEMTDDLFYELAYHYYDDLDEFHRKTPEEILAEIEPAPADTSSAVAATTDNTEISKYDRIKKIKEIQKVEGKEKKEGYHYYAFIDLFKDDDFVSTYETQRKRVVEKKDKENNTSYKERQEKKRRISKRGHALGIDRILYLDPYYFKVNNRMNKIDFVNNEAKKLDYQQLITSEAEKMDLDVELLGRKSIGIDDVQRFNDITLLTEWMDEQIEHEDMYFVSLNRSRVKELSERYSTRYLAWSALLVSIEEPAGGAEYLTYCILMPPILPYLIYKSIKSDPYSYYITTVFDMEEGRSLAVFNEVVQYTDRQDIVNNKVYYVLKQIKKKRK